MKARDIKRLEKIAIKRGGHVQKTKNQLDQIVKEATAIPTDSPAGIPYGRTIIIKNNKITRKRKKE